MTKTPDLHKAEEQAKQALKQAKESDTANQAQDAATDLSKVADKIISNGPKSPSKAITKALKHY